MEKNNDKYEFFKLLLKKSKEATPLFSNISPQEYQNWLLTTGHGHSESGYEYRIRQSDAQVSFVIGCKDLKLAKRRFDFLKEKRHQIESKYGEPLHWIYKDNQQAQSIVSYCKIGGLKDKHKWPEIQKDLVDRMVRLERAFRPYIRFLP